jgi:hypothetical protein
MSSTYIQFMLYMILESYSNIAAARRHSLLPLL